jgi:hypothetical protein
VLKRHESGSAGVQLARVHPERLRWVATFVPYFLDYGVLKKADLETCPQDFTPGISSNVEFACRQYSPKVGWRTGQN